MVFDRVKYGFKLLEHGYSCPGSGGVTCCIEGAWGTMTKNPDRGSAMTTPSWSHSSICHTGEQPPLGRSLSGSKSVRGNRLASKPDQGSSGAVMSGLLSCWFAWGFIGAIGW